MIKIKKYKNKKSIIILIITVSLLLVGSTIAFFTNEVVLNKSLGTIMPNVKCDQQFHEGFGNINFGCYSIADTNINFLLRIKYDEYWSYHENIDDEDCISGTYGNQTEFTYSPDFDNSADAIDDVALYHDLDESLSLISNYDTVNDIDTVTKNWTQTFLNDFIDGDDGWYYYEKVLKPGDEIMLLTTISSNIPDQSDAYYNLIFDYESFEEDSDIIDEVWGLSYSVDNLGNVTWDF